MPAKIIIVDDGSTDDTPYILDKFTKDYPNLFIIVETQSKTTDFQRIPHLWNMCLDQRYEFQMIGAADCEYNFNYAELLLIELAKDPNLVICSGDALRSKSSSPRGAGRFVRQSFFYQYYKQYPSIVGYESEIIFKALINDYTVSVIHDAKFNHLQKLGEKHNFKEFGQSMRALGYHPLYVLGRFVTDFLFNKGLGKLGSIAMLYHYLTFHHKENSYLSYFPEHTRQQVRALQVNQIKKMLIH